MILAVGVVMGAGVLLLGNTICEILFGAWLSDTRLLLLVGVWYGTVACLGSFVVTALHTQSESGPAYTAKLRTGVSVSALTLALFMTTTMGAFGPLLAMALTETVYLALAYRRWLATDTPLLTDVVSATA